MSGCSPGVNCDHCGDKVSFSTRRAPGTCCPEPDCDYANRVDEHHCTSCGKDCRTCPINPSKKTPTCCPEPSCDQELAPVKCKTCGATCPCPAWERPRKDRDYFANAKRGRRS